MAPTWYAGRTGDYLVNTDGAPVRTGTVTVWRTPDGSQPVTALIDYAGRACTEAPTDGAGGFIFAVDDGYKGPLFVRDLNGRFKLVEPMDMVDRIAALETNLDGAVATELAAQIPGVLTAAGGPFIPTSAGKAAKVQATPPTNPADKDLWVDTTNDSLLKRYDLATVSWKQAGGGTYALLDTGLLKVAGVAVPDSAFPATLARDTEVTAAVAALVAAAPATLDTLAELAAALGADPNFAATTAATVGALPKGTLGYAQTGTTQGSITTEVDLTSLTKTVAVGAGRRIRVSFSTFLSSTVAGDTLIVFIKEGATQLGRGQAASLSDGYGVTVIGQVVLTPTAGAHTYKLTCARAAGTGTVQSNASGVDVPFVLVEDIGV